MKWFGQIMWVCKHLLNPINTKLDWRMAAGRICKKYSIGMAKHFADEFREEFYTDGHRRMHILKLYQHIVKFFEVRKGEWKAMQEKAKHTQAVDKKINTPIRDHWKKEMQERYISLMKRRRAGHDVDYDLYKLLVSMKHHNIKIPGVDDDTLITDVHPADNRHDMGKNKI